MCHGTTTLFHGLFVTTASLVFAAQAHQQTHGPRRAINRIVQLWTKGTLDVDPSKSQAVKKIPPEVWEQVKLHLIARTVRDCEKRAVALIRCDQCVEEVFICECGMAHEIVWNTWTRPDCEDCVDGAWKLREYELVEDLSWGKSSIVVDLLLGFGLRLVSRSPMLPDPENHRDFDSTTAIAIPLRAIGSADFPSVTSEAVHDYGAGSGLAVFSPNAFNLPRNAAARFKALVETYKLEVIDQRNVEITSTSFEAAIESEDEDETPSQSTSKPAQGDSKEKKKAKKKDEKYKLKFGQVEPRWIMWSCCRSCC